MKKFYVLIVGLVLLFSSCNITKGTNDGATPFSTKPTHIEFWNGGTKIAEYENATVSVYSVLNSHLVGESITWYYYEVEVNGEVVDTIIDSESLCIKYSGQRRR